MKPNHPLPETYTEILTYLRDQKSGLTTREIFDLSKKKRFFQLDNITQISYIASALRSKKLITTSDAAKGKIHRITEAGLEAIADEPGKQNSKTEQSRKYASTMQYRLPKRTPADETANEAINDLTITDQAEEPESAAVLKAADEIIGGIQDEETDYEIIRRDDDSIINQIGVDKLYSEFPDRGQTSETDQTDAPSDIIAKFDDTFGAIRSFLIEYLTNTQPPVTIRNKTVKLSVLQRLESMYNEEISQVLGEIRLDLEQLEAE